MDAEGIDPGAFRKIMGQFATGVTVITVQRGELMHGMTANTFTSLSLDPPLVLFCVRRDARMAKLLDGADGFAISILGAHQEDVSRHFAGRQFDIGSGIELLKQGPVAPLVPGSLGALSCTIEDMHEGGDHWIVVGRVIALHGSDGDDAAQPLVFFGSHYVELREKAAQPALVETWSNDAILIYHDEWTMGEDPPPEDYVRAHIWE